ncbi:MAG: glycosyltransferase [Chloroflexota bacterium]
MQIHQFHPTVTFGDAVSNQILSLQAMARQMGHQSEIFCQQLPVNFGGKVRQIQHYHAYSSPDTILLLHFSLGYPPDVLSWLTALPDKKVILYHNITPHSYFAGINAVFYDAAQDGRAQFPQLRPLTDIGWADSSFNGQELMENGWDTVSVLPIVFDKKRYQKRGDKKVLKQFQNGVNLLFVGRVAPNKHFEDLLLTFYYFKKYCQPQARLLLVGSAHGMEPYTAYLDALIAKLNLTDVHFVGHVSQAQLIAYYQCATVFLSMSEHEGFGVPLLESMFFEVPVVAYKSSAVPETLGGSGLMVTQKDFRAIAELIGLVVEDNALQQQIVVQQKVRLPYFEPDQVQAQFAQYVQAIAEA